jgi:hypothetical protein
MVPSLTDPTYNFIYFNRNLAKARDEGYGIKLSWDELTEELLYDTIQSLLHNPR